MGSYLLDNAGVHVLYLKSKKCYFLICRTPSCPLCCETISLTSSAKLNASLKISTLKTLNVSNLWRELAFFFAFFFFYLTVLTLQC